MSIVLLRTEFRLYWGVLNGYWNYLAIVMNAGDNTANAFM